MATRELGNIVVALDIGTSKVVVVIAEILDDGSLNAIGVGSHESKGLSRGVVSNIELTVQAISHAVEAAELMANCQIREVYTGIAGSHISATNSDGVVAVNNPEEIEASDIARVIETARAVPIPSEHEEIHVLTQNFSVDGQDGVFDPTGMSGRRLESRVHIVTAAKSAVQNIRKCITRCGLVTKDIILQPLASSTAILSKDEKDLGVCVIDIGGGTTDIMVFIDGHVTYTKVYPIAGNQVSSDISIGLRTSNANAERLKINHGCAFPKLCEGEFDQTIEVPQLTGRSTKKSSKSVLSELIFLRVEELFKFIADDLRVSGYLDMINSGVVLTGGSSQMEGMAELGEYVFGAPVRIGNPKAIGGMGEFVSNPRYSTVIGLLEIAKERVNIDRLSGNSGEGLLNSAKRFINKFF